MASAVSLINSIPSERLTISRIIPHLCGLPKRIREKRLLLMLRAFFDESGTDPSSDMALVMGGFVASVEEWERATARWDEVCMQHPKIDYFSRKEATSLSKQFATFSRKSAQDKTDALARVISQFDLQGFCVTVSHDFFAFRNPEISKGMFGSRIYDWAFITAIKGVIDFLDYRDAGEDKVDFIFDCRQELKECIPFFYDLKNKASSSSYRRCGTCIPGNDQELAPLQMADLLGGELSSSLPLVPAGTPLAKATGSRGFIHIPCKVPSFIPDVQQLHTIGKKIFDRTESVKKRYFRDGDHSPELWAEVGALQAIWKMFEIRLEELTSNIDMREVWNDYEKTKAEDMLKRANRDE
jgi:hypothetical protein